MCSQCNYVRFEVLRMDDQSAPYPLPPGIAAGERHFVKFVSDGFDALVLQNARVFKAGNSLTVRIPSGIAKRIGLEDGAGIDWTACARSRYAI